MVRIWARAFALALTIGGAAAQEAPPAAPALRSPILTVDVEQLYAQSLFGQKVAEEYRARSEELAQENRAIEADLAAEEEALTLKRPTLAIEDFRREAEAFDLKVQGIRSRQDQKQAALQEVLLEGREAFFQEVTNDLAELMIDAGAAVILDRRSVFLSVGLVDITEAAISKANETYRQRLPEAPLTP